ncbi:DUF58 domain-containing protein [Butyrivibrio sp. MC2021]|uniref:DUF58 domain-containing protein n=1 Tax=Butyrivibrio sp. MC2021 TaxID=1408306 RepID=UPI00047C53A7|nr:DUF58 domain-containing protein [Butyrivibrio sp. MC2021]
MSISFSKKGLLLYLLILLGSLVLASFYGGPVSFVLLYALLLMIPISLIYMIINIFSVSLYQEIEVHKLAKGDTHNYRVLVENSGILPIHNMTFGLYRDRSEFVSLRDGDEVSLDVRQKKEISSGISCKYAGAYNIGVEDLFFTDPFRIMRLKYPVPYSFRAIVSPRITDIADDFLDIENMVNSSGLKSARLFEETPGSDMRAYRSGDPLSAINWKVSARLSELMVRVPDKLEKRTVTLILLAVNVPEREQDTEFLKKRDYFLEFVVSAAWHFGQQRIPVKLIYPAGTVRESVVDSYDTFLEFYNIVADGIFYSTDSDYDKMKDIADSKGDNWDDMDIRLLIREDKEPGDDYCTVID